MIPLVTVPYDLTQREFEVGLGAARIAKSLRWLGETVDVGATPASDLDAVCQTNRALANRVRAALTQSRRALVLAGNCSTATGTLGGIAGEATGILWFDAHGDFNTPETTISGSMEGMALGVATGTCHPQIREAAGLAQPIAQDRVLLAGVRDLDAGERELLLRSRIEQLSSAEFSINAFENSAAKIRANSSELYLHLDLDAVDPAHSPGVNFEAPGGLTPQQLLDAVSVVAAWPELRVATIANYNPNRDPEGVTLRLALRLAAILGRSA